MDAKRPSADVYDHYRRLVSGEADQSSRSANRSYGSLDVALCWTVVVPNDGLAPFTLEDIGARLSGGTSYETHDAAGLDAIIPYDAGPCPVAVDCSGPAITLYEYGFLGSTSSVLQRLSINARVYNAYWNVNSNNLLSFATEGKVLLGIDAMFPGTPDDHPNLTWWPELAAMPNFFMDFEERDNWWNWRPEFLTAIELATGARLSREWLNAKHPYLTFLEPIAD